MDSFVGTPRELTIWLMEQDPDKRFECKERRLRRSTTQNSYYWAMLNQLARKLRMPDSEVHMNMLRDYGVCYVLTLAMHIPPEACFEYYDEIGTDYVDGQEGRVLKVYKRSSLMDSAEFSDLIDGMRQECEAQGIDVMTPEEIARLRFVEPQIGG